MATTRKLAALADRLEELSSKLKEEWRQRELRAIAMTPQELASVRAKWWVDFLKQFILPKQDEAGRLLEEAWQAGAFRDDADATQEYNAVLLIEAKREADFATWNAAEQLAEEQQRGTKLTDAEIAQWATLHRGQVESRRHSDIFLGLWQRWLPTKGYPYRARKQHLAYDYVDALVAFAEQLRGDGKRQEQDRPKGVTRFDAALELQSSNDAGQSDRELRAVAYEMSQRWLKRRTIKWPTPIGIDPDNRQADLFDVAQLVRTLADAESGEVVRYGGETKLIAKLREKRARESLPVGECIAIRARRTTRTTRISRS